jgi:hypothetical protein
MAAMSIKSVWSKKGKSKKKANWGGKRLRRPAHQSARSLPLLEVSGSRKCVRGACASGDGGWNGPEEAEAVWRCRERGVLLDGTGDSGSGSVVN